MVVQTQMQEYQYIVNSIPPIIPDPYYLLLKRLLDYLLTIITLPIWLLVVGICALLIKIESPGGPVFFTQKRTGQNGKRITVYKFRTMVENAKELKKELWKYNELEWPDFKISDDPRITKIGRWLRKTSMDELPQLFNVLKGEMSLVGPRPTSFGSELYHRWQTERLDVIPGMTGLWQVFGRGQVLMDERVRMEIAYVRHRSLGLDFYLLYRTFLVVVTSKGAI